MAENKIADKILRLKKLTSTDPKSSSIHHTYNYANLQQEHKELKACNFFQPSHKLVCLLSDILLTGNCPNLNQILKLKPQFFFPSILALPLSSFFWLSDLTTSHCNLIALPFAYSIFYTHPPLPEVWLTQELWEPIKTCSFGST
jgi:hypothetical protein